MKFIVISLIPIEFFTKSRRQTAEEKLKKEKIIEKLPINNDITTIFKEICPQEFSFYSLSKLYKNSSIAFMESSACIVIESEPENFTLDESFVRNKLISRRKLHSDIIKGNGHPILKAVKLISESIDDPNIYTVTINYVFSFNIINTKGDSINKDQKNLLKVLAEPSIADIDDMLSSQRISSEIEDKSKIKKEFIEKITDSDVSGGSDTFITWASIVSLCYNDNSFLGTKNLLISLEVRLQTIWNRCFSINELIKNVIDNKQTQIDIEELYWSFMPTLDDSKSVLSSTYSTRANFLFSKMVKTSNIENEIERLHSKINLLEKFVAKEIGKTRNKYQKIIEIILFILTLSVLVPILMPVPVIHNSNIAWLIFIVIAAVGLFTILRKSGS